MAENGNGSKLVEGGLMSLDEAWKFLSISRGQLYNLMASGDLAYVKIRRRRMVPRNVLIEFARAGLIIRQPAIASAV
jgi:excisionase family DNA binding protein